MKFGIEIVPNTTYDRLVELAKLAEKSNFDYIWVTDHYNNRNVYSVLTLFALNTFQIKLGAGVANPYHVHPAVTASAIATVNEISNGRAVLGLAAGDKTTLEKIGITWDKPLKRIKEAVEIIRLLFSGNEVYYNGEFFKLNGAKLTFKSGNINIYIGAQGPKMIKLAFEVGDGVLVNSSNPDDFIELKKFEKKINFDLAAFTCFSIDSDSKKAKDLAKNVIAFVVSSASKAVLRKYQLENKAKEIKKAILKKNWSEVKKLIGDEIAEKMSISGNKEEVIEKIDKFKKAGVSQIVIGSPIAFDKKKALELIGKDIIPLFKD